MFSLMAETVEATTSTTPHTQTDTAAPSEWGINDAVIHLREWGTNIVFPLPRPPSQGEELAIGAMDGCWLRLWDPSGRTSRRHAVLTHRDGVWHLADVNSKNGVYVDNKRMFAPFPLVPGSEIRIGRTTLVPESQRLVALRELLARLVGMKEERREEIDQALCSIRIAATYREPLLICGPGNLASIAKQLHRRIFLDRPFVVARPPRKGMDALAHATGGTLCVLRHQEPSDLDDVVMAIGGSPVSRVLFMMCAHAIPRGNDIASQIVSVLRSVLIAPLAERIDELPQIIDAYTADAMAEFGGGWMTVVDREWVAANASESLSQIETATRRIVALHSCQESISQASRILGVAPSSLSEWANRRALLERPQIPDAKDVERSRMPDDDDPENEGVIER